MCEILELKKVMSSQTKELSLPTRKTKMKQASDFSSAILEAEAPTDYFHKSSTTQESSTSQGKIHQPDWKKENLGLNNDSPGLYSEKVYHTQA